MSESNKSLSNVKIGENTFIADYVNLYGCSIGNNCKVGSFVEIQKDVTIGDRCKISSHSFLCSGVKIGDGVFIGHGVLFINDRYPKAINEKGNLKNNCDWKLEETIVCDNASIGTGSVILCGIRIGENAFVGAGSVVTHDVPPNTMVYGNPARVQKVI